MIYMRGVGAVGWGGRVVLFGAVFVVVGLAGGDSDLLYS